MDPVTGTVTLPVHWPATNAPVVDGVTGSALDAADKKVTF